MNNQISKEAVRRGKEGFSLIELIIAVSILAILSAVAVTNVKKHIDKTNKVATMETIQAISSALTTYSLDHGGKYPESLNALVEGDDPDIKGGADALNDAWAQEIKYERLKNGRDFKLTSAGPDGDFGTDDDLTSK